MRNIHEPSDEFVERLERQVGREVSRRNRVVPAPWWIPRSRAMATLAVAGLMLVSMGIGAAATAAGYEAKVQVRRNQLAASYEQRLDLARQRLVVANDQLKATERQVSVGMASGVSVFEGRFKVAEAQAQVKSLELQLEEIRITGLEPRNEVSAPRVAGRDFVTERLRIEMSVPEMAFSLEQQHVQDAQNRFAVGMADGIDVEATSVRMMEMQAALLTFKKKLDIRQKFLGGTVDAIETELRVLEAEAELRTKTIAPRLALAQKELQRIQGRVDVGQATQVELSEAKLRLLQLQTDRTKADLDLLLVQRQIQQHKSGR